MLVAVLLAELALYARARRASRSSPRHSPIPSLIGFAFWADIAMWALQFAILRHAPRPFVGGARLAYHLETGLVVGWPCLVALVGLSVFLPHQRRVTSPLVVGAHAGAIVLHVALYPLSRAATARFFVVVELAAVAAVGIAAYVAYGRRKWGSLEGVVLFLAGAELVVTLLGPYATNPFKDWDVARMLYFASFSALALWYSPRPHP